MLDMLNLIPWWVYLLGMATVIGVVVMLLAAGGLLLRVGRAVAGRPAPATAAVLLARAERDVEELARELASSCGREAELRSLARRWQASQDAASRAHGYDLENVLDGLPSVEPVEDAETIALGVLADRLRGEVSGG